MPTSKTTKAKAAPQPEVLVLGEHPAAYLAAILLHVAKVRVAHSTIPDDRGDDRLVVVNPAFFSLHPLLESLKRKLDLVAVYGLRFLSDDPNVKSEFRSKSTLAYVGSSKAIRAAMAKLAEAQGVEMHAPKTLLIHRVDEHGIDVTLQKAKRRPRVLLLSGRMSEPHQKMLGLPDGWGTDVVHRYTYVRLPGAKWADVGNRPTIPMSLNLRETLCWGWMLPGPKSVQVAVEQPIETLSRIRPQDLLAHWVQVLRANGALVGGKDVPLDTAESMDLPLTGVLAHEGVANRTLLIGPAGGFYSACAEDIYPNAWSAVFAVEAVRKALKEPHLQDALQPYRSKWRTTLGEYLRGPQQNFRFLLPLVYRNEVMTTRLTESILLGKSVVR